MRGEGGRKEKPAPSRFGHAVFFFLVAMALHFVDSGSGLGVKPVFLAILLSSDRSFRIVGTMAHLWGCPSARFLR